MPRDVSLYWTEDSNNLGTIDEKVELAGQTDNIKPTAYAALPY